jgi:hypothetical protein
LARSFIPKFNSDRESKKNQEKNMPKKDKNSDPIATSSKQVTTSKAALPSLKKKKSSTSAKAGVTFPAARIKRYLKDLKISPRVSML